MKTFLSALIASLLLTLPSLSMASDYRSMSKTEAIHWLNMADEKFAHKSIPETTCYGDYRKLRKKTIVKAVIAPVIGFASMYALGYLGGLTIGSSGSGGFDTLAAIIAGVALGVYVGFLSYVTYQSLSIIRFIKAHNYTKLIEQAYDGSGKKIKKIAKKLKTTEKFVATNIVAANESGILCDGSLRNRAPDAKLRKRIARKKDIVKYLKTLL